LLEILLGNEKKTISLSLFLSIILEGNGNK